MKTSQEIIDIINREYDLWRDLAEKTKDPEIQSRSDTLEDLLESIGELK